MIKSKYVYSSCLGNAYLSDEKGLEHRRCSQCGDTDTFLGEVTSPDELRQLLSSEGYYGDYIEAVVQDAIKYGEILELKKET